MNIWDKAPFVRLLPPFLAGVLFAAKLSCPFPIILACFVGCGLICFSYAAKILVGRYLWRWIPGLFINGLLFTTGLLLYRQQQVFLRPEWLGHYLINTKYLVGTPESIAAPGPKSARIVFIVSAAIDSTGSAKKAVGKVILYIPNSYADNILPGDEWVITVTTVQKIRSPQNPAGFDYAQYCASQNIYHQAYLKERQLIIIRKSKSFNLSRFLASGQLSALKSMRETVPDNARGLAMALLIGYRNEVDRSLLQAYANTGVVHVIAVSGMHLGLIFLLLQKVIAFPDKKFKVLKWLKAILVLMVIWIFSGIAGAAASIIRAAFMFSTVLLAKLIRKPLDNIQSICLGAFALLCYNPLWLWDAGFQLSFAALLSIICYQPLVAAWLRVKNPILKGIWELTAVTLAAQVLTLPISIGLFHQAPVYFLFANLLAVPISSIALITAILQWIITSSGFPITIAGQITGFLIQLMNAAILHINSLPGALINHIEWTTAQTCTVYVIIIAFTSWLVQRSKQAAWLCLVSISIFMTIRLNEFYQKSRQEVLLVFQIPNQRLVVILQGKTMNLLASECSFKSPDLLAAKRYYHTRELVSLTASLYRYRNCLVAIPANTDAILPLLATAPDYLLLPGNLQSVEPLIPAINSRTTIVFDGKIPVWRARQWIEILTVRQIKFYNTWEEGALEIPFNKF